MNFDLSFFLCTNTYFYTYLYCSQFVKAKKKNTYLFDFWKCKTKNQNAMPGWCSIYVVVIFFHDVKILFLFKTKWKKISRFLKKIYKKAPNVQILFIFPFPFFRFLKWMISKTRMNFHKNPLFISLLSNLSFFFLF